MTIGHKVPFAQALAETRTNQQRIFSNQNNGLSGYERITQNDVPDIAIKPKFQLRKSDAFFTIGSCFARNIERALAAAKIRCLVSDFKFSGAYYEASGHGARNGALNAYTPTSMKDTIDLVDRDNNEQLGLLEVGEDEYIDMMVSGTKPLNRTDSEVVRTTLLKAYQTLPKADAVVITLGYTESWQDAPDDIYVNRSPGGSRKTVRHADRYNFHNLTAEQTQAVLRDILDTVSKKTGNAKIILTVSPVPIHGTFTGRDVVTANLYSKSTLLTSALTVAQEYDTVDYFPSYEMVMFSPKEQTWDADGVHVKMGIVDKVIDRFIEHYVTD